MSKYRCEQCGTGADVPEYRTAGGRRVLMHQYTHGDEVKVYCERCANSILWSPQPDIPSVPLRQGPWNR